MAYGNRKNNRVMLPISGGIMQTDDFPFDDKYKRYVMNPEGKYSTLVKKRKSKRDQKKYGTYEEQ